MAETGWCYGVTFPSSSAVEQSRGEAVMQVVGGLSGMPSAHVQSRELGKGSGGLMGFISH